MAKSPSLAQRRQALNTSSMAQKAPLGLLPNAAEPSGELKALDAEELGGQAPRLVRLPIEAIGPDPDQPRKHMAAAALQALTTSLQAKGLRNPVHVRRAGGAFVLIEGERRWRAARRAGFKQLDAFVENVNADEAFELALIENMQRQNLNPLEEAAGIDELIQRRGYNQTQAGRLVGRSKSHISKLRRVAGLPDGVKKLVSRPTAAAQLGLDQLYQVALQTSPARQMALARRILDEALNTQQARRAAKDRPTSAEHPLLKPLAYLEKALDNGGDDDLSAAQRTDAVRRLKALVRRLDTAQAPPGAK